MTFARGEPLAPPQARWRRQGLSALAAAVATFLALAATTARADPVDRAALEEWADEFFQAGIAQTALPGGVIAVVADGEPVLVRGYGVANVETGAPMDGARTLVRIGSITKVFNAIAALQMADEGRLQLDEDVNGQLTRFQVPATFAEPITPNILLEHAAGFARDRRGRYDYPALQLQHDPGRMTGAEITRLFPPRLRPPGAHSSYDNHSFALLALVEADADGRSFRDLMQARVFEPLGMTSSVVGLPDARESEAAMGHVVPAAGAAVATGYDRQAELDQGSGDITTTAADMARFMIAVLNGGELDGRRVLSPAAFRDFTNFDARRINAALPGLGRAIVETDVGGRRGWRHDGGLQGYGATMVLFPESRIGIFVALNGRNPNPVAEERLSGLIDALTAPQPTRMPVLAHFYPINDIFAERFVPRDRIPDLAPESEPLLAGAELARLAGIYGGDPADAAYFPGKLTVAVLGGARVRVLENGDIMIGRRGPFHQIRRGLFENEDGERIGFTINDAGVFMGDSYLSASRQAPWYAPAEYSLLPLAVAPIILLSGLLLVRARERKYRRIGAALAIAAIVVAITLFLEAQYSNQFYETGQSLPLIAWRIALHLAALSFIAAPIYAVWGPRGDTASGAVTRTYAWLLMGVGIVLVILLWYWGALGRVGG